MADDDTEMPFVDVASEFLEMVAPDFKCLVCSNEDFFLIDDFMGSKPAIHFEREPSAHPVQFALWLAVCNRCGFVHHFSTPHMWRYLKNKGWGRGK